MMRKILLFTIFSLLGIHSVFGISLNGVAYEGENITITGNGFGNTPGFYGKICVEGYCYSGNIVSWSNRKIIFRLPTGIQNTGNISVYITENYQQCYTYSCYDSTRSKLLGQVRYKLTPLITEVSHDGKYISTYGLPGEELFIYGKGFGDKKGTVEFGKSNAEILQWQNNQIKIKLPKESNGIKEFKVKSQNGKHNTYQKFELYPHISNDTYSSYQYYLKDLGVTKIWNNKEFEKKGDGITVAIIDSGLNHNNLDIKHSIWNNSKEIPNNGIDDDNNGYIDDIHGWNFVRNDNFMDITDSHGTMVAGIIAGKVNNNIGIAGIAENTIIMPLIVFHNKKGGEDNQIINAIKYATDNGANIINLSLGGPFTTSYSKEYDEVIKYAYEKGVVIVVASGNGDYTQSGTSRDLDIYQSSPVCNDGGEGKNYIIGVSATDKNKLKAGFADYGKNCIDISAPGVNIASISHKSFSNNGLEYELKDGTSFSAPIVAGAIALLWSNRPYLDNTDIYEALSSSGDDIDSLNPYHKGKLGKFLNIENLLKLEGDFSDIEIKRIDHDVTLDSGKYLFFKGENFSKKMYLNLLKTNIKRKIEGNLIDKNNVFFDISQLEGKYYEKNISFSLSREYGKAYTNKLSLKKIQKTNYIEKNNNTSQTNIPKHLEPLSKNTKLRNITKKLEEMYKINPEKIIILHGKIQNMRSKTKQSSKNYVLLEYLDFSISNLINND